MKIYNIYDNESTDIEFETVQDAVDYIVNELLSDDFAYMIKTGAYTAAIYFQKQLYTPDTNFN